MLYYRKFALTMICLVLSSCATMFGKKHQEITFDSEPAGAKVYVAGQFVGRTPVTTKLPMKPEYEIAYIYDTFVREFIIQPKNYTVHTSNKVLCTMDFVPGILFVGLPVLTDMFSGSCRSFENVYFRAITDKVLSENS